MRPSVGRIVHFVGNIAHRDEGGRLACVAALVVAVDEPNQTVTLHVFWPFHAEYGSPSWRVKIWRDVQEGDDGQLAKEGTWHWPERVE